MKYVVYNAKRLRVRSVRTDKPKGLPERMEFVEVSDKVADAVEKSLPAPTFFYEGGLITQEEAKSHTDNTADVPVPQSVDMVQLREELIIRGMKSDIEEALDALPDGVNKDVMKEWWEYATSVNRTNSKVQTMADNLSLTDEVLDDIWLAASKR